jgi:FMN phosphatase YigB (HAD superfamily)
MSSTQITTVIFDMDNTLIDWSGQTSNWRDLERRHLQNVFEFLDIKNRLPKASFEQVSLTYRTNVMDGWAEGRTTLRAPKMTTIMQTTLETFGVIFDDSMTVEDVLRAYDWKGMDGVLPFSDVPNALQKLLDRGIKIGLLTNAFQPMWMRDAELEIYDLLKFFSEPHTRMTAADLGFLKPNPRAFRMALERMGAEAEESIYVGDSLTADVAGAQSVNMRAVLREIYDTPPPDKRLVIPDAVIQSLDDLLPLVEDWDTHLLNGR